MPLVLVGSYWWFFALYGLNPTDDGFVLAQSWRILGGEAPHTDFTSPRPVGSGLLHLPEVLTPAGMLALDRLVVVLQLFWIAVASLQLFRNRRWAITPLESLLLVTSAFLLSSGTWPIMAWHTIDGLFIGLTAFWVATRAPEKGLYRQLQWPVVWLLSGFAPLVKQGFAVVPVLVISLVLVRRQWRPWVTFPLMILPGILYLLWVGGEVDTVRSQLYSGSASELLLPWNLLLDTALTRMGLVAGVAAVLAFAVSVWGRESTAWVRRFLAVALVATPALVVGVQERFSIAGSWSYVVVLVLVVTGLLSVRTVDRLMHLVLVLGITYASCMSWGVTAPSLMAGPVFGLAVVLLLDRPPAQASGSRTFALALLLVAIASAVLPARAMLVYREPPRAQLTATVDLPQLRLIRMSPQTATYVASAATCLERFPASRAAILPDGPGLYPLLGLHSPWHTDWWLTVEYPPDHQQRVADAVRGLSSSTDWLVLGQTWPAEALGSIPVEALTEPGPHLNAEVDALLQSLPGQAVTCHSFVGKYERG